jgi:hypothetical protein
LLHRCQEKYGHFVACGRKRVSHGYFGKLSTRINTDEMQVVLAGVSAMDWRKLQREFSAFDSGNKSSL